ncbi:NAD(P)H-dependent glycerol-3-phosphate dehydrogenase [Clostridium formicaceticum]|uniref:Glycerol-3-phosphate dehydrogenase [NAD(P)+] n=1 Tax=Clostridium formicaceticum TaxID=1497 RepID=A0AAC9WGH7_9CLOT|nr:NAD(P)H-dependent glycerol-3-phosphate dehydrogenase [Clostridium formicaceticum]AOY77407.1 glycerol-3-phosphate dehydrogenase [Clostridium formicaceticum]ARE87958.1 Glycerol-3-phosphate dehydrogenase [Clostridium formicaceticum]
MKKLSIAVLGAGSWGTALSLVLNSNNHVVNLWMRREEQYHQMLETRENRKYLPEVKIPSNIHLFTDSIAAIKGTDIILLAVPTQKVREVLKSIKSYVEPHQIIVNAAKGIEQKSQLRISEVVEAELPQQPYAMLSGPSHAEEVATNMPTAIVAASLKKDTAEFVQHAFMTSKFRVYTNPDVAGVELGGALKNVIAFGAGIADGLGFGDNVRAALMTRGIREIARLGKAMGADISTFAGLSGIGDLIVTCTSMHSRNRRAGILIGKGKSLKETLQEIGMVVEGITTTNVAYELAMKYNIEMPITEEIYKVLYEGRNPKDAVINLMTRDRKNEMEEIVNDSNVDWQ